MSWNDTAWLEAGLICCGLIRGITFSVRHIKKMSAEKNRIATTGSHCVAHSWMCVTHETCGEDTEGTWLTCTREACACACSVCARRGAGTLKTPRTACVTPASSRCSSSAILGMAASIASRRDDYQACKT